MSKLFKNGLNTNKGRMVVFLLAFAIVGGGYALYHSFAYSNSATNYYDKISGTGGAVLVNDNTGVKYLTKAWSVPPGDEFQPLLTSNFTVAVPPQTASYASTGVSYTLYHSCFTARTVSAGGRASVTLTESAHAGVGGSEVIVVSGNTYTSYCGTGAIGEPAGTTAHPAIGVSGTFAAPNPVGTGTSTPDTVYISSISLQW